MTASLKYELTDVRHPENPKLRRIRALRDILSVGVKAGDLGGWVESTGNLDQDGNAWVFDNARVYGNARVHGNAEVHGNARVCGVARVSGSTEIGGGSHQIGSIQ